MKRLYIIMSGMILGVSSLMAQPSAVVKAAKSVFTLTTFNKDGGIISSTQGVFIDSKGTCIATFKPFIGAVKATVVDATGKSMDVDAIMGADELYDVAKFRVGGSTTPASIAASATAAGSKVWLVPYSIKKPAFQQEGISSVEHFNTSFCCYIFASGAPENAVGCPFVNKEGQVIGLMHHDNGTVTAIDANYARQLKVTGMSSFDAALRESGIRTALPDTEQEAMTLMTLSRTRGSQGDYAKYVDEFIGKFPSSAYGYKEKATLLANDDKYEEADKCMAECIKKSSEKDAAYSNYADLIYHKIAYKGDSAYQAWTLDKAAEYAQKAHTLKALPVYRHQEAQIRFLQGKHQEAYDMFMQLTKTSLNSGELYYEAAQAKSHLKASATEIEALLDSAVTVGQRTGGIIAPYYLARGQYRDNKGEYRKALADYNQYDSLSHTVDPTFFYTRYKCETKLRMWQQALLDIARTCYLAPQEPTYFAEWASLDLRIKRIDEGIGAATACIKLAPEYADGYLLLGLLQKEKNLKDEAVKNLEKAKQLGDPRAEEYLKKYK